MPSYAKALPQDQMTRPPLEGLQTSEGIIDSVSPGEIKRHEINVDRTKQVSFACFSEGNLRLIVTDPAGNRMDSAATKGNEISSYMNIEMMEGQNVVTVTFGMNPPPGKWTVEVTPGEGNNEKTHYVLTTFFEGAGIILEVSTDKERYQKGDTVLVIGALRNDSSPILNADVTAFVWKEPYRADFDTLQLFDDGTHGDRNANDGQYSNAITNTADGGYFNFSVKAEKGRPEPFTRLGGTMAMVARYRAKFNRTFSDSGRDTNGDTLFDELVIRVGIKVTDAARYHISGEILDKDGKGLDNAWVDTFLTPNDNGALLVFEGDAIYDGRGEGPYRLSHLSISVEDTAETDFVDFLEDAYTTEKYSVWDFQGRGIVDAGGYFDRGVDIDGDGLYDSLVVGINVDIRTSDSYVWQASLFGSNGTEPLDWVDCEGPLKAGINKIEFAFKGSEIRKSGQDGPYEIPGVAMYGRDKGANITETGTIRTRPYKHTEFER